ncbi:MULTISPECIES: DUF6887 family protein [unclassified Tolypothrix]|uniref:DUF6887 family protein n=1 Tax=unclassified Tolypothrix TaxID=2649714 RepID=UPI0005EAB58C|nr:MULTISPECIES: hypothetical protein [unclassified Tolypothrix]BAY92408.1 hypothetical protein NIES3275_44430 [Microchaete diplosiphon NIES-3275]EKF05931.1 hypothetical protein FDUTEX481_00282 [Tolypothrix sp. PCC 7601]MBE9087092.1 hypothetical protein [Tolypothrix sp. LEGE 11397]QIR38331.1 hypothetical protein HCG51_17555 [Tolypothrix sp. PCC 7910]UYD26369.1 hypothetical protein HGR01_34650 [Tolypothrix sp. PCC 7712]
MTQPNFADMTDAELRVYVLHNPNNTEAFYAYVDRLHAANPNPKLMSIEEAEAELEKRVNQGQR